MKPHPPRYNVSTANESFRDTWQQPIDSASVALAGVSPIDLVCGSSDSLRPRVGQLVRQLRRPCLRLFQLTCSAGILVEQRRLGVPGHYRGELASADMALAHGRCSAFRAESSGPPSHKRAVARVQCGPVVLHSSKSNRMPDSQRGSGRAVCGSSVERRVRGLGRGAQVRAVYVLLAPGVGGIRVVCEGRKALAVMRLWLRSSRSGSPPSRW